MKNVLRLGALTDGYWIFLFFQRISASKKIKWQDFQRALEEMNSIRTAAQSCIFPARDRMRRAAPSGLTRLAL